MSETLNAARAVLALLPLLRGQEEDALLLGAGQNPLRELAEHPIAQAWIAGPVQQAIRDKVI